MSVLKTILTIHFSLWALFTLLQMTLEQFCFNYLNHYSFLASVKMNTQFKHFEFALKRHPLCHQKFFTHEKKLLRLYQGIINESK